MNRGLSLIFVAASLIVLAGCTISGGGGGGGGGFDPDAELVNASSPSNDPPVLDSGTIFPGETIYYEVRVSESVAGASEAIYYDLDVSADQTQNGADSIAMRLYNLNGSVLASSVSFEGFADGTQAEVNLTGLDSSEFETQAIAVDWICFGPCIIEASGFGTRFVRLENVTGSTLTYDFYAYGLEVSDTNEPNDSGSAAVSLSGSDEGAIEFLGDEDFFNVTTSGQLRFESAADPVLRLRAQVIEADGDVFNTVAPGSTVQVISGDTVRIFSDYADLGWAGSPSASRYSLEIVTP